MEIGIWFPILMIVVGLAMLWIEFKYPTDTTDRFSAIFTSCMALAGLIFWLVVFTGK